MARVELILPKMGESVTEATLISWSKNVGDMVEMDETIVEIATDKVDSEVPSTHDGKLVEQLFSADDVIKVGETFAILEIEGEEEVVIPKTETITSEKDRAQEEVVEEVEISVKIKSPQITNNGDKFYSPLVRNIAAEEGISMEELSNITGTGKNARVTKTDILSHIKNRNVISAGTTKTNEMSKEKDDIKAAEPQKHTPTPIVDTGNVEIIEMDRMRKLISNHMTMSKATSAHITSFVEADMTNIVNWRNSIKVDFKKREGQNITFTPIIIEAMVKAVKDFPMINVSVDGTNIHIHKNVNIGMAAALPDGNLIVPVIKEAQNKNLVGITKSVNDLATRARSSQLNPDDINGGTITMTNVGTFGNLMGTPIINQPQVAIMACGVNKNKPVVLEAEYGDVIAIRHMMFLSLSYDHRVVDGALGGQFVRRVADYLEQFDTNTIV